MKSFLVYLASLAVMVHMTLGCHWHHGMSGQACANQCSSEVCNYRDHAEANDCCAVGREHSDHEHDLQITTGITIGDSGEDHGHSHFGCSDDGCDATKVCKFSFWPVDFWTQYLCGAENSALVVRQNNIELELEPFPDCSHTATSVRAHLLLGVQLI